jgi:hypothetical protein
VHIEVMSEVTVTDEDGAIFVTTHINVLGSFNGYFQLGRTIVNDENETDMERSGRGLFEASLAYASMRCERPPNSGFRIPPST